MNWRVATRMMKHVDRRLLMKLAKNAGWGGFRSIVKHKQRLKRGEFFPPILFISVINSCNLRCQGCWVDVAAKQEKIEIDSIDRMIDDAKRKGNRVFGLLGGEPFMHRELLKVLEHHPDCYFQIFTNGQLITEEVAAELRRLGNATPLISIEGSELASDTRRGRLHVLSDSMRGLQNCLKEKLFTGVCTSVAKTNIDDLLREQWVDRLIDMGVMYVWYHVYRPVGPEPCPELALDPEEQLRVREFVVETRVKKPIIVIDAYHDASGKAVCPAAIGLTHHISPTGAIEPCPIIQFAVESIDDQRGVGETISSSSFLEDFRKTAANATRGCIVLERPDLLLELANRHGARDTTVRQSSFAELERMTPRRSQFLPGREIPERSLMYRLAKKWVFDDGGAYRLFDKRTVDISKEGSNAAPPLVKQSQ